MTAKTGGWWRWRGDDLWIIGPVPSGYVLVMDEDGDTFELTPEQIEREVSEWPGPTRWDHYHDLWLSLPDRLRRLPRRILYGKPPCVPPPPPPVPPRDAP